MFACLENDGQEGLSGGWKVGVGKLGADGFISANGPIEKSIHVSFVTPLRSSTG